MKLPSDAIHRMAYNVHLYTQKKSSVKGMTLWQVGPGLLRATGYDDYFALSDMLAVDELKSPAQYLMTPDGLTALEEALRGAKTGSESADQSFIELDDLPLDEIDPDSVILDTLRQADQLCVPEGYLQPASVSEFALAPNRLRRLSLIKPGTYPIDCRTFTDSGRDFIGFRAGPTVRGAMACMDRAKLLEMYEGEELWRS